MTICWVAFAVIFLTEFSARCWDSPSRRHYLRSHWLDLGSCVPLVGGLRSVRILRLLRLGAADGRMIMARMDRLEEQLTRIEQHVSTRDHD